MTWKDRQPPVVITGIGTVNALGGDAGSFWDSLVSGACGIRTVEDCFENEPGVLAAVVTATLPHVRAAAPLSRTARLALAAAEEAVRQAGLEGACGKNRVAIVVGTTTGGIREAEDLIIRRAAGQPGRAGTLLSLEKSGVADALASRFGFAGPRYTVQTACASGATAILVGFELVRRGLADAALVGGTDALARLTLSGFRSLRLLDPTPCRPFDRARRGLSLGEGAGMLVLERRQDAAARGAEILAVFLGAGQSTDAHHITAPATDGAGAARAISEALDQAGVEPGSVDHVNAHGTGTLPNDAAEAAALHAVLGRRTESCPVTSIKGAVGHTLGAAGGIEAVAAVLTLRSGLVPPTVGLEEPDPALALDLVRGAARRMDVRVVLSNSFGFGGANAVLCLGSADA